LIGFIRPSWQSEFETIKRVLAEVVESRIADYSSDIIEFASPRLMK